jgi:hypothetical protein
MAGLAAAIHGFGAEAARFPIVGKSSVGVRVRRA